MARGPAQWSIPTRHGLFPPQLPATHLLLSPRLASLFLGRPRARVLRRKVSTRMKVLASYISYPERGLFSNGLCKDVSRISPNLRRIGMGSRHVQIISRSKESLSQDFQGFAEPVRLLPITEAKHYTENMLEKTLASFQVDESSSFYVLQIRTSSEFGSCLRDLNAAVLLSLIDINGDTVLQRIPTVSSDMNFHRTEESESPTERIHFQRGSVDIITFQGPKLGKINALWIGIESGSWRLDGLRLTVISTSKSSCGPDTTGNPYDVLQYHFQSNDILFGEDEGTSMTELRPQLVKHLSMDELLTMNTDALYLESASSNTKVSADESMEEYTNLKLSLLVYDSLFIATGTAIIALSTTTEAAYPFAAGGICGFLYLLLLQRSVDGLSASALPSTNGNIEDLVRGFRGPLATLAFVLAATAAATRYGLGDTGLVLTPQYLFLGFAGFLTCKLSVVMAAFKPLNSLKGK